MYKIINFGVREDELAEFQRVADKLQVECLVTKAPLTAANMHLLDGCDGWTDVVGRDYDEAIYQRMQAQGMKWASLRLAGYDSLNYQRAAQFGVGFARVPDYSPNAIAEFSVALAIGLVRKLPLLFARTAYQDFRLEGLLGREIRDLRVGIMGTGHIGKIAAEIFYGFGSEIVGYDIKPDQELAKIITYEADLDAFFKQVELLLIYLPLNDATKHIVSQRTLGLMPRGSYLVNVGRGGLVKSDDLAATVEAGHLAGAALDVHEDEATYAGRDMSGQVIASQPIRRLQALPNVILTPHMAFYTDNAVANMVEMSVQNVLDLLKTGQSDNLIK